MSRLLLRLLVVAAVLGGSGCYTARAQLPGALRTDLDDDQVILQERFDIVYTSYGVLAWLPDIRTWGQLISRYLKPGGFFYMVELHPFSMVFESGKDKGLKVDYSYFHTPEPIEFEVEGTYAVLDAELKAEKQYEWQHTLGDILTALTDAGLKIEYLHEFDYTVFQHFSCLKKEGRLYTLLNHAAKIPLLFSLKANKIL